jgi:hypothetical protein
VVSPPVTKIWGNTPTKIQNLTGGPSDYNDAAQVSAQLTDNNGAPISGKTITFTLGSGAGAPTCSAVTNATGTATCSLTPNQMAGTYTLTASFAGDGTYALSSASKSFQVTLEEDTLGFTANSPTLLANGQPATFSATLKEDGVTAIGGRTLVFMLGTGGTAQTCSGTTNASGTGSCNIVVNQPLGPNTVSVAFASDGYYLANSASAPVLIFAFLGTGSFVIGDLNGVVGNSVTFWGAQWSKLNSLSGGPAPNAFKGFADQVSTPPACGGTYATDTGNSAPPPPGPLPSYMAVINSGSITQSGSVISGNIRSIDIVRTNPGYMPNPANPGTGTVVAVLCHQ